MIEMELIEYLIHIVRDEGFPIFIAVLLLWEKMKTNGSLKRVVENNNKILLRLEDRICSDGS